MAEAIDVLVRQRQAGRSDCTILSRKMSWAGKSGRAFRLDEVPGLLGLISKPVGIDEKDIKAIVDRWLR